jgi:phage-related protein
MVKQGTPQSKPLIWEHGEIKTPPLSPEARVPAGTLLRRLQEGELLGKPHSERMAIIGPRCYELRVQDKGHWWRIFYRIDEDAIIIVGVFSKTTNTTPKSVIDTCKARFARYDQRVRDAKIAHEAKKPKRGQ